MIAIKIIGENNYGWDELKNGLFIEDMPQANLQLFNISGLNPPPAVVNTETAIQQAGSVLQGTQIQERTVDISFTCPKDRRLIYAELVPGELVRVEIYGVSNYVNELNDGAYNHLNLYGYIETVNIDYFSDKVVCVVQIKCPDPFLYVASGMTEYTDKKDTEKTFFPSANGWFTGSTEGEEISTPFTHTPLNLTIEPNSTAERVIIKYAQLPSSELTPIESYTRAVDIKKTGLGTLGKIEIISEKGKKSIKAGDTPLFDSIVYPIEFPYIKGHNLGGIDGWHNNVSVTAYNASGAQVSCKWRAWVYNRVLGV